MFRDIQDRAGSMTTGVLKGPAKLWGALKVWQILMAIIAALFAAVVGIDAALGPLMIAEDTTAMFWSLGFLGLSLLYVVLFAVCAVLTLWLSFRMMRNLHRLESPVELTGPFTFVAFQIVPLIQLLLALRPFQQTWKSSFWLDGDEHKIVDPINQWWAAWIVSVLVSGAGDRLYSESMDQIMESGIPSDSHQLGAWLVVAGLVAHIVAIVLMIRAFDAMTAAQQRVIAQRQAQATAT
jgi:hypothetical protein